jgi:hypothetical protein
VKININKAAKKNDPLLQLPSHGSDLPERSFAIFPLIVFLPDSASNELYGSRNDISITIVHYEQMNVIGGNHIIQNR